VRPLALGSKETPGNGRKRRVVNLPRFGFSSGEDPPTAESLSNRRGGIIMLRVRGSSPSSGIVSEAQTLAEGRLQELAARPFQELLRFEEDAVEERVTAPSGRTYRVRTSAHWDWDHDPYEGDLLVQVHVRGRWWERHSGLHRREPERGFLADPEEFEAP
jgi:hypothetical protein